MCEKNQVKKIKRTSIDEYAQRNTQTWKNVAKAKEVQTGTKKEENKNE